MQQRKEKVKFRLKGKEVIEVVWSRPIRSAFLCHLILRHTVIMNIFIEVFKNLPQRIISFHGKNFLKKLEKNCILEE